MPENFIPETYLYLTDEEREEEEDYFDYFYDQPGSEPRTLNIAPDAEPSRIILINYDSKNALRKIDIAPKQCLVYLQENKVSWIDI
jgi:magnesium transporter